MTTIHARIKRNTNRKGMEEKELKRKREKTHKKR